MKKLISILLALTLIVALGSAALASSEVTRIVSESISVILACVMVRIPRSL